MAKLPSGTVTFLFSDVEGSTRPLTRLRGRYAKVLGEHQRLLRAAFDEHHGREVHTEAESSSAGATAPHDDESSRRMVRSGRSPGHRGWRCPAKGAVRHVVRPAVVAVSSSMNSGAAAAAAEGSWTWSFPSSWPLAWRLQHDAERPRKHV
jgi:class 3 adenylate cyclase